MKEVKRYRVDYKHGIVEDDGSHDYWPATTSFEMVPASDFDAVLKDRDALQGKLTCAADAIRYARINFGNVNIHTKIWHRLDEALVQIGDISEPSPKPDTP